MTDTNEDFSKLDELMNERNSLLEKRRDRLCYPYFDESARLKREVTQIDVEIAKIDILIRQERRRSLAYVETDQTIPMFSSLQI